jgi:hypothetical protein
MLHDLFHQQVYKNLDFTIEADYTAVFPQYMVYDSRNGRLVGQTNANNFMGVCRIIMNEYKTRNHGTSGAIHEAAARQRAT